MAAQTKTQTPTIWQQRLKAFLRILQASRYPKTLDTWEDNPITYALNAINLLFFGLIATALTGLVGIWILGFPGGLVGMIGELLARLSQQTGITNFSILYPAFGFSQIFLLQFLVYFMWVVFMSGPSTSDRLEILDQKIKKLYEMERAEKPDDFDPSGEGGK